MPTVLEYSAAADQAVESAELDPHAYQQIKDPRNLTLLLFFRYAGHHAAPPDTLP